jgi:hypothetical protein
MAKKPAAGSLTATDIFEQLYGASNSSLVFTGLIDKSDDDPSMIRFARGLDCQQWKKIPTSAIEKVQFVQTAHCKDHVHPLVHIFLKEPQSPDGHAFAAVAHAHPPGAPSASMFTHAHSVASMLAQAPSVSAAHAQAPGALAASAGQVNCQWVQDIFGHWRYICY